MVLSAYVKNRIILLREKGKKIVDIHQELLNVDQIKVSRQAIGRLIKKYGTTGSISDKPKPGRPSMLTIEHFNFIDAAMERDDELTSAGLQRQMLERFKIRFSLSTLKTIRRKLGWIRSGPKYCQLIREANQVQRLEFVQRCLANREEFDDVIFTDESSIWMERHGKICFRRKNELPKLKPKPKHPYKVHIWGGISKRGATDLVIFTGILKKEFYVETILRDTLLPYTKSVFPDGTYRFQQDNDPKHKSRLAINFIEQNNINYWPTPAESPDLNLIENLWHELKNHLRVRVKPKTKEELVDGIEHFWQNLNVERCTKYINHLQKVMPVVLERNGKASGY